MAVHSKVKNPIFLPAVTFPRRTGNEQIELNGNMLFLHMHSVNLSRSGGKVIPNVSKKGKKFKGRKCAQKINEEYRRMQADMFNLYPAIGEVNGRRSNYSMGIIEGEKREFGKCDVEIKSRKV